MKWLRRIGYAALAVLSILALALAAALWVYRDIPAAKLEARYISPSSRFMHIDGTRIYYRDEGAGPAVLLLHGDFGNLLDWDPWVRALKDKYRVVRFDMTAFGLTGPDPSGDYSIGRTLMLTERFADALGLKRFVIGGTSLGSVIATRYAALHPDRISKVVLVNPAVNHAIAGPGTAVEDAADVFEYVAPRALASYLLRSRAGDPARISDDDVDHWYEMWMREGNREAMLQRLGAEGGGDEASATAQVSVPVLILWGAADPLAPAGEAEAFMRTFRSAPDVRLVTYPGVGYPALQEAGSLTGRDVRAWLDGSLPPAAG